MENVLIICTHLTWDRAKRKDYDFMQPMAGVQLASHIDKEKYNIELYHELFHGPYNVNKINVARTRYKIVILSGLQKDFDRMRQLSYYFRRSGSIVIAGGSICGLFPEFSSHYYDIVCSGHVGVISRIFKDYETGTLKNIYYTEKDDPNHNEIDHAILNRCGIRSYLHLIETSRGCKYICGFCSLTAEKVQYEAFDFNLIKANIENSIQNSGGYLNLKKIYPIIWFIDNLFGGNSNILSSILEYIRQNPNIKAWGALVTQNTLSDYKLIDNLAESKCKMLFVGIESLDNDFLVKYKKKQNYNNDNELIEHIDYAQKKGIIVNYGWLFDPRINTINEMYSQIQYLLKSEVLTFPSFFSLVSPLVGTKSFWESVEKKELTKNLLLRDMEGTTIAYSNSKDSVDKIKKFFYNIFFHPKKIVKRRYIFNKTVKYIIKYKIMNPVLWYIILQNNFRPYTQARGAKNVKRTLIGGKDKVDPQYMEWPKDIALSDRIRYFDPIKITNEAGEILPWILTNLNNDYDQKVEVVNKTFA